MVVVVVEGTTEVVEGRIRVVGDPVQDPAEPRRRGVRSGCAVQQPCAQRGEVSHVGAEGPGVGAAGAGFREAEVGEQGLAGAEDDVGLDEVPVGHAGAVGCGDGAGQRPQQRARTVDRQGLPLHRAGEGALRSEDGEHLDPVLVDVDDVDDRGDVRVPDAGQGLGHVA